MSLVLLLGGSAALGLYLGWQYVRRIRSNPVHSAVHLILGAAGLEFMVMLRRGAPDGTVVPADALSTAALVLLAMTMMSGLLSPMIGRYWGRRPCTVALIVHAALGALGLILFVAWLAST
jgi:hypothetical protein